MLHLIDAMDCGGAQELLLLLAEATPEASYPTTVAVIQPAVGLAARFKAAGARLVCLGRERPSIVTPWRFARFVASTLTDIWRLCRRGRFAVLHCHLSDASFLGIVAGRLAGVRRILVTVHSPVVVPVRSRFDPRTWLHRIVTPLLLNRADWVIAVSDETAATLLDLGIAPDKLRVVQNGIDAEACLHPLHPVSRDSLGVDPSDVVLISVGRLTEQKGQIHLIDAMPQIIAAEPRAKLLLLGTGPLEQTLRHQAQCLGVADRVIFCGVRPDVSAVLAHADIFVLPSLWEGTSLALLEAMAAAKPIVATTIAGNLPILSDGHNCLLVPPADPSALAEAVIRLLTDPGFGRSLAARARSQAVEHFDIQVMLRAYERLWSTSSQARTPARPPRVVVMGLRGVPARWGGVEHQCEELYSRLAAAGWDITIHARKGYVDPGTKAYKGMRVVCLPAPRNKYLEAFVHTLLAVLHASVTRASLIHIYSQGPFLLSPLARLLNPKTPLYFTCGGLDWQRRKWNPLAARVIRLGERLTALLATQVVVVSNALGDYYRTRYGIKALCIVNGVNIPGPTPFDRAPELAGLGVEPGRYVLFVGRLVPEKRIEDLIAACKSLPDGVRLVVAGGAAGAEDYFRKLTVLAADDPRIVLAGYRYGETLAALYSNALAYVTASELEGLPLTLLEAMSHGLPCVASDIPPHVEVLAPAGIETFPVRDTTALATRLAALATLPAEVRRSQGERCREHVRQHYSWDQAAGQLAAAYQASLEKPR